MSLKFYFYVYAWFKKYLLENIHNINIVTKCIRLNYLTLRFIVSWNLVKNVYNLTNNYKTTFCKFGKM